MPTKIVTMCVFVCVCVLVYLPSTLPQVRLGGVCVGCAYAKHDLSMLTACARLILMYCLLHNMGVVD